MGGRKIEKWQAMLLMLITGGFSCGVTIIFIEISPLLLLAFVLISALLQVFLVGLVLYRSRFWENLPQKFSEIMGWGVIGFILGVFILGDGFAIHSAVKELWLQQFGETTEATITDRERFSDKDGNRTYFYHQITFVWEVKEKGGEVYDYTAEKNAGLAWSEETRPGETITIRYLPDKPNVFRVEEGFARSPINDVGLALLLNIYISSAVLLSFWLENPQSWANLKRRFYRQASL